MSIFLKMFYLKGCSDMVIAALLKCHHVYKRTATVLLLFQDDTSLLVHGFTMLLFQDEVSILVHGFTMLLFLDDASLLVHSFTMLLFLADASLLVYGFTNGICQRYRAIIGRIVFIFTRHFNSS